MGEAMRVVLGGFWPWLGTLILVAVAVGPLYGLADAMRRRR